MWENEEQARAEIKKLVGEFYHQFKEDKSVFKPGDRINYASRVFDEKEMQSLTDATLDFWLTTGRFCNEFEKNFGEWIGARFVHLVNSGSSANLLAFTALTAPELGKKLLQETIILDVKTNVPILSIQPFNQDGYDYAVKVRTMNVADHDDLQRMVGYQIRKFNACRKCLKCESICRQGAISIVGDSYYIDPEKCVHCKMCMTAKYLDGGCMMNKYLLTK